MGRGVPSSFYGGLFNGFREIHCLCYALYAVGIAVVIFLLSAQSKPVLPVTFWVA